MVICVVALASISSASAALVRLAANHLSAPYTRQYNLGGVLVNKRPINRYLDFRFIDKGFFHEIELLAGHRMEKLDVPSITGSVWTHYSMQVLNAADLKLNHIFFHHGIYPID